MAKGGARARSGPPPDPNALRRDRDGGDWIHLPAGGRTGEPPCQWPLPRPKTRERALWVSEWRRPQAIEWERNGQEHEVALYIRWLVKSEAPNAPTNLGTLVKQLQEALGLSLPGLARNHWVIDSEESTEHVDRPATGPAPTSVKERLKLVSG